MVFSILPKATTDNGKYCNGSSLSSPAFKEAISRADFSSTTALPAPTRGMSHTHRKLPANY